LAEFNKCKEDSANVVKTKLCVDIGNTNLYRKPYDAECMMTDFIKFSGDDERTTWEHISQYTSELGEVDSYNVLKVRLFVYL
jgi:hypothetical protein